MNIILPDIEPCESCGGAVPVECDGSGMLACPHCGRDQGHILCYACSDFDDDGDGADFGERLVA